LKETAALAPAAGAAESGTQSLLPTRRSSTALNATPVWLTIANPLTPALADAASVVATRRNEGEPLDHAGLYARRAPVQSRLRRSGRVRVMHHARTEHRRRGLVKAFRQGQRGRAEPAFGERPSDVPVRAAAARAMIDLILAIDRMIAALGGIE
jgi:hypothetical protein